MPLDVSILYKFAMIRRELLAELREDMEKSMKDGNKYNELRQKR
ncbi:hypothetical protein XBJ2_1930029 [Xenorhabdus bovienii str. Jollieti]|uniref:Uncharacterized protein n=1 Tax=Xenorhabdus bovienii (strain SS-2004) TaxID=406818 RepID=D3V5N1_XENBS|nr:hypothetical protein XBJ1_3842 [Xenorhabdus bovienii SS-2004]CDH28713.1 hypothetical protein XBJ2_1930029 [Xenorhabdus bovienii str. Jollieti]